MQSNNKDILEQYLLSLIVSFFRFSTAVLCAQYFVARLTNSLFLPYVNLYISFHMANHFCFKDFSFFFNFIFCFKDFYLGLLPTRITLYQSSSYWILYLYMFIYLFIYFILHSIVCRCQYTCHLPPFFILILGQNFSVQNYSNSVLVATSGIT